MSIETLASNDVEITDLTRYRPWLKERWGIQSTSQHNRSLPILSRSNCADHLDYLRSQTDQDRQVYDCVTAALDRTQKVSVYGSALV